MLARHLLHKLQNLSFLKRGEHTFLFPFPPYGVAKEVVPQCTNQNTIFPWSCQNSWNYHLSLARLCLSCSSLQLPFFCIIALENLFASVSLSGTLGFHELGWLWHGKPLMMWSVIISLCRATTLSSPNTWWAFWCSQCESYTTHKQFADTFNLQQLSIIIHQASTLSYANN